MPQLLVGSGSGRVRVGFGYQKCRVLFLTWVSSHPTKKKLLRFLYSKKLTQQYIYAYYTFFNFREIGDFLVNNKSTKNIKLVNFFYHVWLTVKLHFFWIISSNKQKLFLFLFFKTSDLKNLKNETQRNNFCPNSFWFFF